VTSFPDYIGRDNGQVYENILGGTWTAYGMASDEKTIGPAWADPSHFSTLNNLDSLVSVDVVFTSDKSKWSQCIVVEEQSEEVLSEGTAAKFNLRDAYPKNSDGSNR
jgi:hypothetical protein